MSINESRGASRSNLTRAQQHEALAAIYGIQETKPMELTHEEIERMREIVASHDSTNKGGIREFDLNNPPKQPYKYQEFPRLVYHHKKRTHKPVHNASQLKAALAAGFDKKPFPAETDELDAGAASEAALIDEQLRAAKEDE
jgi:hypothetical protein